MILKENKKISTDISIVCASHDGKKKLPIFLGSILKNTYLPKEIILSITNKDDISLIPERLFSILNIKIIKSDKVNQIEQRLIAINNITTDYILQLDDDLILNENTIENYWKNILETKNPTKLIVGGYVTLPNSKHQSQRWYNHFNKNIIFKNFLLILNKLNPILPMTILKSGRIIPLTKEITQNSKINCQWLNSSILYHKNAIKFLPKIKYKNKAYYEDVFFSYNLYKNNYILILDSSVILHHPFISQTNLNIYLESIKFQFTLVKLYKLSFFLFVLDFMIFLSYYIFKKIFNK